MRIWTLARLCVFAFAMMVGGLTAWSAEPLTPDETSRLATLDAKPLHQLANVELAEYLQLRNRQLAAAPQRPSPAAEIGHYVVRSLGQPHRMGADQYDLAESDCVILVDRCIALGLCEDWRSYHMLCNRLRHKDGVVEPKNWNHFTEADWIPNNAWLLEDITGKLGPADNRPATEYLHRINRKRFYTQIGLNIDAPGLQTLTQTYIPAKRAAEILPELRTGDIVLMIRGWHENRFCDHLGVLVRGSDGVLTVVHSTSPKVRQESLTRLMERCPWLNGFKFLRVREDARSLVAAELTRLGQTLTAPTPAEQDERTRAKRAERAAKTTRPATTQPSSPAQ